MTKKIRWIIPIVVIILIIYVVIDAKILSTNRLKINQIEIIDQRIPLAFDDAEILVFSDSYGNEKQLKKVLDIVESNKPDFIVFLGNLLSESPQETEIILNTLKMMDAPLGKYAIMGEHDYQSNPDTVQSIYLDSDFRIIYNQVLPMHRFTDDYIMFTFLDQKNEGYEDALLLSRDLEQFSLTFHHSPSVVNQIEGDDKILISGETEHGKVNIPIFGSIYYKDNYIESYQKVNDTDLYLTSGIGTSNPEIRFGSSPDILYITLKSSQ